MPTVTAKALAITADAAYRAGRPVMTDAEFDALGVVVPCAGRVLLSLDKRPMDEWRCREMGPYTVTGKVDGCAIALAYVGGRLQGAWTRTGRCAMHVATLVASVPPRIASKAPVTLRGELYGLDGRQSTPAAALRRKTPSGDGLAFVGYEVLGSADGHSKQLRWLEGQGVDVLRWWHCASAAQVVKLHQRWRNGGLWAGVPTDGIVVRVDDGNACMQMGHDGRVPRYAMAMK